MEEISIAQAQAELDRRRGIPVWLHLETTTGSYTALGPEKSPPVIAFVRNARISFERGEIRGDGPYRVGLKIDGGWVYAEGLTHMEVTVRDELLLAGHDDAGNLRVALHLSATPFRE